MVRLAISVAAFEAIARTLPPGSVRLDAGDRAALTLQDARKTWLPERRGDYAGFIVHRDHAARRIQALDPGEISGYRRTTLVITRSAP
jgi:hypothetical protein